MDVREKLVELLGGCPCESDCEGMVGSCPNRKHGYCNEIFKLSYCSVSKLAQHLIAHGVTVQEWIPVKDRLPDYFTSVLVWCPGNKCIYAAYRNARQEWYTFDDTIAGHVVVNMVTHWMPMPQPPKGE